MAVKCLLPVEAKNCNCRGCAYCGWNSVEANRRAKMVAQNKLTVTQGEIRALIIKRKDSE